MSPNLSRRSCARIKLVATTVLFACVAGASAFAQRPATASAGYETLDELLQHLPSVAPPVFDEQRALWLGALPLSCLDRLQQNPAERQSAAGRGGRPVVNSGASYFWTATYRLVPDHDRVRAFWGCNDWHSAVGSTWAAVRVLELYPESPLHELTREKLAAHLGRSNVEGELGFFHDAAAAINPIPSASQRGLFERPYGFAWLLVLDAELRAWPDSQGRRYAATLEPLAQWMADSLGAYFTALVEPARTATQTNSAISMSLALDYAAVAHDTRLRTAVDSAARKLFLADTACAVQNERESVNASGRGDRSGGAARGARADTGRSATGPNDLTATARGRGGSAPAAGGPAVVSPCLTEAAVMGQVLDTRAYVA